MDAVLNPYAPGAGRPPAALVGRDIPRRSWQVAVQRVEQHRGAQPIVLYGLRGVGKTVLLSEHARTARDHDWMVAQIEAGAGRTLREMLGEALHAPLADLAGPTAGARLLKALKTALSFKASYDSSGAWNFGVDVTDSPGGGADTGRLETDVTKVIGDLSLAAGEEHVGLAVLIDEAQDLTGEELTAVCATAHAAGQNSWPMLFALAGLPSLPRQLAEAKSYAERLFVFEHIRHLDEALARDALLTPATAEGVTWQPAALDHIVAQTSGYPYFLQQFGQDTWNIAAGPVITLNDARAGAAIGRAALDNGFFRARWDRATPAEKKYLQAMAIDGDTVSASGDIGARLYRPVASLSPVRAALIAKGLIYAPEHGVVAFTVPAMADFIRRQPQP